MKVIGKNLRIAALGTVMAGSLFTAGLGLVHAEPPPPPPPGADGLINVVVDGATVLDSVPTAQAAQAVTAMCAMSAPAASAMVADVDRAGGSQAACTGRPNGDVILVQNLPANAELSPVFPGTKAKFKTGPVEGAPAGGGEITGSLPTNPDNMSGLN
jgi:hypothetical protein